MIRIPLQYALVHYKGLYYISPIAYDQTVQWESSAVSSTLKEYLWCIEWTQFFGNV